MGMYTEFFLQVQISENRTPKNISKVCKDHPFYGKISKVGYLSLHIHTSIKNQSNEIQEFLNLIHPCVRGPEGFVGFHKHESEEDPVLWFYSKERFMYAASPQEAITIREIRIEMEELEEINRNLNRVNTVLKKKISGLMAKLADALVDDNAGTATGHMVTDYECPECGSAATTASKGLMQGGVNCICVCGCKYHVCAF